MEEESESKSCKLTCILLRGRCQANNTPTILPSLLIFSRQLTFFLESVISHICPLRPQCWQLAGDLGVYLADDGNYTTRVRPDSRLVCPPLAEGTGKPHA